MRLKNKPPAYFLTQGKPRSWLVTENTSALMVSFWKRRRAAPVMWPAGSLNPANSSHPATANRLTASYLWHAWIDLLTPAKRTMWEIYAAHFPVLTYKGITRTLNGFQFFFWWMMTQSQSFYISPGAFHPNPIPLALTITPSWHTTPPPYNINLVTVSPGLLYISFDWTGPTGNTHIEFAISKPQGTSQKPPKNKFARINSAIATAPTGGPLFFAALHYHNVIEIPPTPGLRTVRLTLPSPATFYVPPPWVEFNVDLSIPYP